MTQITQHSIDAGSSRSQSGNSKGSGMTGNLTFLLIGGGIGATLALLFAPKAGLELRGDIANAAQKGYDNSLDMAQKLMDQSRDLYGNLKAKADDVTGGAASRLEDKVLHKVSDLSSALPNGGGEILEGLTDGGRDEGSARGTNTGF